MLEVFLQSFKVVIRHWMVYRKNLFSNTAPIWAEPALFTLAFGFVLGAYVKDFDGRDYASFIAPGLVISTALFTAFFECSYGFFFRYKFENVYQAIMTTPVDAREIIFGEFLWVSLKGAVMSSGVCLALVPLGVVKTHYFPLIPLVGSLVALPCGAIGLISATFVKGMHQFQAIYALLIAPMFFLSGAFYPMKDVPEAFQLIASFSPLYHGVKMSQSILWEQEVVATLSFHLGILILMILIFCSIAYRRVYKLLKN